MPLHKTGQEIADQIEDAKNKHKPKPKPEGNDFGPKPALTGTKTRSIRQFRSSARKAKGGGGARRKRKRKVRSSSSGRRLVKP